MYRESFLICSLYYLIWIIEPSSFLFDKSMRSFFQFCVSSSMLHQTKQGWQLFMLPHQSTPLINPRRHISPNYQRLPSNSIAFQSPLVNSSRNWFEAETFGPGAWSASPKVLITRNYRNVCQTHNPKWDVTWVEWLLKIIQWLFMSKLT